MRRSASIRHAPAINADRGARIEAAAAVLKSWKETKMRNLCLTLAVGAAVLTTGALTSNASAMPYGHVAIKETVVFDRAGMHCTHWWNGRWHPFEQCFRHHRWHRDWR